MIILKGTGANRRNCAIPDILRTTQFEDAISVMKIFIAIKCFQKAKEPKYSLTLLLKQSILDLVVFPL
jgi:hypothetical protein